MKKLISVMLVIFTTLSFTGCFKNEEIKETKIKRPGVDSLSIEGVWEIIDQYKIKENAQLEKVDKIEIPLISISKKQVSFQETEIESPKFKFKKVKREYLPKEFDSVVQGVPEEDSLIDVIAISDNTNQYMDFIKENDKRAYIYTTGELLIVQKVDEGSQDAIKNNNIDDNSANIANLEKKKGQDSGVLIGIKEPGSTLANGNFTPAKYKTVWVYSKDGKIQTPKIIDGILLPRANGGFSNIDMKNVKLNGKQSQSLNITNQSKSGKAEESKKSANEDYREITFVGKDYIGLQYYDDKNTNNEFDKYKILPVDSIENNKGLNIEALFEKKGIDAFNTSLNKFIASKDKNFKDQYDINKIDTGNIIVRRKSGTWALEGKIESKAVGLSDVDFDIDIPVVGNLVNWDNLPLNWNKINEIAKDAKDAVSSPMNDFMVILNNDKLEIYNMQDVENVKKPVLTFDLEPGSSIIMNEWATGNEFVTAWDKVVDSKIK